MLRTLVVLLVAVVSLAEAEAQKWGKTVKSQKGKTTTLQFYFHDVQSGKNPSAVPVARATNSTQNRNAFGTLFMADDKLTVGPDPNSKLVGRAQGIYGSASQNELAYIMAISYTFLDGPYNGSSIILMGRNPAAHPLREFPVVAGTGMFRMGRGYAVVQTYWVDFKTGDAIVGYNLTILHSLNLVL